MKRAAPKKAPPPTAKPCPVCGKPRSDEFTPFCSRRCADVDLHRWLKGNYVIPGAEPASGDEGPDEGQGS